MDQSRGLQKQTGWLSRNPYTIYTDRDSRIGCLPLPSSPSYLSAASPRSPADIGCIADKQSGALATRNIPAFWITIGITDNPSKVNLIKRKKLGINKEVDFPVIENFLPNSNKRSKRSRDGLGYLELFMKLAKNEEPTFKETQLGDTKFFVLHDSNLTLEMTDPKKVGRSISTALTSILLIGCFTDKNRRALIDAQERTRTSTPRGTRT